MVTSGRSENVSRGPSLDEIGFPDVLVYKAVSDDGKGLDLVLCHGEEAGRYKLGFFRLPPASRYTVGKAFATSDKDGKASFEVDVDGRTEVKLAKST